MRRESAIASSSMSSTGHVVLAGEVVDRGAVVAGQPDRLVLDAVAAQLALDAPARAQPVGRGPAAVEGDGSRDRERR